MKKAFFLLIMVVFTNCSKSIETTPDEQMTDSVITHLVSYTTEGVSIQGSMVLPHNEGNIPLVLILSGSGPTDRNGNNNAGLMTNSYKMISDSLVKYNIASLRIDKRGVGASVAPNLQEEDITFDTYLADYTFILQQLETDDFSKIILLGHSEGALFATILSNRGWGDALISVAGTAQTLDDLLLEQLADQPANIVDEARMILDSLANGQQVTEISDVLESLFRTSVQPYLISSLQYDPLTEMALVTQPTLVVHGTTDIQVRSEEANILADQHLNTELVIIENMNHVLKKASSNYQENIATYSNRSLSLHDSLISPLIQFIDGI